MGLKETVFVLQSLGKSKNKPGEKDLFRYSLFSVCSYNSSISSKIPLWSHKVFDASAFLFLTLHMLVNSKYS